MAGFDPTQQKPREFAGFPDKNDEGVSTNPLDLMLQAPGASLSFKKPSFPERSLKAKARRPEDLGIVDVVKAVQAAFVSAVGCQQGQGVSWCCWWLAPVGSLLAVMVACDNSGRYPAPAPFLRMMLRALDQKARQLVEC